jgi:hypothetical protein
MGTLIGRGCNELTYAGCCDGNKVNWCEPDGSVCEYDCGTQVCGWYPESSYYWCDGHGADPLGDYPMACGPCTADCTDRVCGTDGCRGSCGTCPDDGNPCTIEICVGGTCVWDFADTTVGCTDGLPCTSGDHCDGNGTCVGAPYTCRGPGECETAVECNGVGGCGPVPSLPGTACAADAYPCTTDECNGLGTCTHTPQAGTCLIGGCRAAGDLNPASPCTGCRPELSTIGWSPMATTATCNDGNVCSTGDHCDGNGVCAGTPYTCRPAGACEDQVTCDGAGGCTVDLSDPGAACPSDGRTCTADTCDGAGHCTHDLVAGNCLIAGICRAAGESNAANPCTGCVPSSSATGWSNLADTTACNDGIACTSGDHCDGQGTCAGTGYSCPARAECEDAVACDGDGGCTTTFATTNVACTNDLLACTLDRCDGGGHCGHVLAGGWCLIAGACVADGTVQPGNECRGCVAATSTTGWSNLGTARACQDGDACTSGDHCDGQGGCTGTAFTCPGAGTCQDAVACDGNGGCTVTNSPDGTACPADALDCTVDACDGGGLCAHELAPGNCLVEGTCAGAGTRQPGNTCRDCQPLAATDRWTDLGTAEACADGEACTAGDHCDGQGGCTGTAFTCPAPGICQQAVTCDGNGGCDVLDAEPGTACPDDGLACTAEGCDGQGACLHPVVAGWCRIDDACVADGAAQPGNACRGCVAAISTSGWTNRDQAQACLDGDDCTFGDHCDGQGACAGTATTCPAPGICEARVACDGNGGCAVTLADEGTACTTDGLDCTVDACDAAGNCAHEGIEVGWCRIGGVCAAAGTGDPDNACLACAPFVATGDWTGLPDSQGCNDDDACTSGDHCNGRGGCAGDWYACVEGTCQASSTCDGSGGCTVAFQTAGTTCDDGDPCTTEDGCGEGGDCAGTPRTCDATPPPAPGCAGTGTSRLYEVANVCDGTTGACAHATHDVACTGTCVEATGLCAEGAGVDCAIAPACHRAPGTVVWDAAGQQAACWFERATTGAVCDDGDPCTTDDACDVEGTCVGEPSPLCAADGIPAIEEGLDAALPDILDVPEVPVIPEAGPDVQTGDRGEPHDMAPEDDFRPMDLATGDDTAGAKDDGRPASLGGGGCSSGAPASALPCLTVLGIWGAFAALRRRREPGRIR